MENKTSSISVPRDGKSIYSDIIGTNRAGRGSSNCNRGGNNNQRRNIRSGRGSRHHDFSKPKKPKFEGLCADLKGRIFDVGNSQTMPYNNTLIDIQNYARTKNTPYVSKSIEGMKDISY